MFADEYEVFTFFDRLPPTVHSGKTFETWRATAEASEPALLHLTLDDLLLGDEHGLTPAQFPDQLVVRGRRRSATASAPTYARGTSMLAITPARAQELWAALTR